VNNKLFVGGLSWDTTEDSLRNLFAQAGTVVSASVITDRYSGRSKGFGFVEMSTPEEAEKAKTTLNGQTLDGRAITVSEARPQVPRENRFGGGGGGDNSYRRNDRDSRGSRGGGKGFR
jgi:RNA recognition motif-containing protein